MKEITRVVIKTITKITSKTWLVRYLHVVLMGIFAAFFYLVSYFVSISEDNNSYGPELFGLFMGTVSLIMMGIMLQEQVSIDRKNKNVCSENS